MITTYILYGSLTSSDVLEISQELDTLLNEHFA
ncbi:aspartyl-phosphate phosphatase Spo0E family protein [Brevibacillus composti]|uniref:Aspartyl-phosphate phosphatase Spo0E family protein n=1 Tax=Brevibacillus composti TaxID=2796470 RepID=A0A7T5JQS2_9BACL|nr:aspartyl-phosphate phosphatase Spo0E family protein [Brevibacillus composti]QUO43546.1 aspartyl-phosphate phosphatase Spo0E family protein [Brevibacillus composti]